MKYVDIKYTIWQRVHFHKETNMNEIIELIKTGNEDSIFDEELGFMENEVLYDTEEQLSLEDNEGNATIEVYQGNDNGNQELIWDNTKNKKWEK